MKITNTLSALVIILITIGCANKKLTAKDVNKRVESAKEANLEAKEKTKAAINARNQYTADYKVVQLEVIEKRVKNIDKQIKSIEKSAKNDANETVANNLKSAVEALEKEKKGLAENRSEIESIQSKNWQNNINQIDSVMRIVNNNLTEVTNSLDDLKK